MSDDHHAVAVSAPGKVLLAGGYLVLDRRYTGLVFGLSARIVVIASAIGSSSSPGMQLSEGEVVVESRQFVGAQWRYGLRVSPDGGGIKVTQLQTGDHMSANPFVETTLCYALSYANEVGSRGKSGSAGGSLHSSRLIILADKDYYSQPPAKVTDSGEKARFASFGVTLQDAHKTGLGSSAALVTSLTAALLTHYLPRKVFDLSTDEGRRTLHNLAQAAHCAAQGKVGSGFDVAAAVYGSCTYRRFSPEILAGIPEPGTPGFASRLLAVIDGDAWDVEVAAVPSRRHGEDGTKGSLPKGLALRMCDVDCGSQTVGMVKKVLAWKTRDAARCEELWDELQKRNEALAIAIREERGEGDKELREKVENVRELMRKMGELSDVPIEPASQTALLDELTKLEGVYGGVVPGAGGYDATALLMDDRAATEQRVSAFLQGWSRDKGCTVKLLGVRGEMEGVREEEVGEYDGWLD